MRYETRPGGWQIFLSRDLTEGEIRSPKSDTHAAYRLIINRSTPVLDALRELVEGLTGPVPEAPAPAPASDPEAPVPDPVNHPAHYTAHPSGVECIQITEHMNFNLGNVVKYVWRLGSKGAAIEDLRKARWYLDREIARLERGKVGG